MMDPVPGTRLYRVNGVLPRVYLRAQPASCPTLPRAKPCSTLSGRGSTAILAPHPEAPTLASDAGSIDQSVGSCELESFGNVRIAAIAKPPEQAWRYS